MIIALATNVIVSITGVTDTSGHLYVQLCRREHFLGSGCEHRTRIAAAPEAEIVFEGVEPGEWAATVWHDTNDNGVMERGVFGIPREPVVISNNPPARFGPPRFDDAAFTVGEAEVTVRLDF
ncbi:MAG: DUF2141 domain-containing protein [Caulobacterales bacterium]|uniref:DUF2141 domain-containing protein n=1 Tax=Glycocaulis sp. TaxID=1969725 RepID=UPI003F9FF26F